MAPNEFVIRPLKNASGEFTGKMNCDTNLIRFDESKPGKNNMKFANITYKGKRVCVETPDMDIPAGVVQYPKPEDAVPNEKVSYSLLMSFDNLDERADLQAYKEFLDMLQAKVLDMMVKRSSEIFGKEKSKELLEDLQSSMVRESDKYAPSTAIGLPFTTSKDSDGVETMKPLYITYDYDMIMSDGLQSNGMPRPDSIIPSIHEINTRRGTVKVIYPLNAVWSTNKGFGISIKARQVLVKKGSSGDDFAFDIGATKTNDDDALLEPSDAEDGEEKDVGDDEDNLGLDD
jgi:hypothetical protein